MSRYRVWWWPFYKAFYFSIFQVYVNFQHWQVNRILSNIPNVGEEPISGYVLQRKVWYFDIRYLLNYLANSSLVNCNVEKRFKKEILEYSFTKNPEKRITRLKRSDFD